METESGLSTGAANLLDKEYGKDLESRRWWILISFSLFSASSAMLWITYSPITSDSQDYYGISVDDVIQFSDSFMYIYFAFSFLGSWLAYKYFTYSLLGAMAINVTGAWLRYIAKTSFALALVGQYLAALAQNSVLFAPVLIADRWFPAHERTWAVTLATLSNLLGWGFGFMFPTVLVGGGFGEVPHVLLYEAIITSVPLVIGILSIKERPRIPPSYSAFVKMTDHASFWQEFLAVVTNFKFVIAAVCFGNLIGQSYTLSSVIVLFIPDASLVEQGLVGVAFIGCGIAGGLAGTIYLTKSKSESYDIVLRAFMITSIIAIIVLAIVIKSNNIVSVFILMGLLGIGLLGFQPFAAQIAVEMTFPVQESISVNLMMVMGQLFGLIGNFLSTASFVGDNGIWALAGLVAPCVIYVVFFHKTETKRQLAERKHKRMSAIEVKSIIEPENCNDE